jgi:Uma2 family endonuclease
MNKILRPKDFPLTSQAAEGYPRRRFTVAEVLAMQDAGIIREDERFELIGGEIVPMAAKGPLHEDLKTALMLHWAGRLPNGVLFSVETTFYLNEENFVEPDFVFYPRGRGVRGLTPKTAFLAVEVSDSSLSWDLGRKARTYSHFAVREVWVINARSLITVVHTEPGSEQYAKRHKVSGKKPVVPGFAPQLAVTLDRLEPV